MPATLEQHRGEGLTHVLWDTGLPWKAMLSPLAWSWGSV